jgi:transcriptional regulator with XRE-family HTH domain
MKGADLRNWRERNNLTQKQLMTELGINSRQTIINWERSDYIPRIAELAVFAIDQIEACRRLSGYTQQFEEKNMSAMLLDKFKQYQAENSTNAPENEIS